jgi:N-acetylglucosaminyldiphosphoundecaprenol N-acetyl-beta-D-mannosaminyltransferase
MNGERTLVSLGGTRVNVWDREDVLHTISERLGCQPDRPLFVASANLDHIAHFGPGGCSRHLVDFDEPAVQWLVLLDGVPLVWRSRRLVERPVEQLAGSDLLEDVLRVAAEASSRVGVLGGSPATHEALRQVLAQTLPQLDLVGCWAPSREQLSSAEDCRDLADAVAAADIDLLVVALGKPRQEHFLAEHGVRTGARVAVAFGAAIDFLVGEVQRAPTQVRHAGLEWLWRLVQEPRRLARRYLVAGPPGAVALLKDSRVLASDPVPARAALSAAALQTRLPQQRQPAPATVDIRDKEPLPVGATISVEPDSGGKLAVQLASTATNATPAADGWTDQP